MIESPECIEKPIQRVILTWINHSASRSVGRKLDPLVTDSKKAVLFLGSQIETAGAQSILLTQAQWFYELGYKVIVAFIYDKEGCHAEWSRNYRFPIINLDGWRKTFRLSNLLKLIPALGTLARLISHNHFDIIETFTHHANFLGLPIAWLFRIPLRIASHHGIRENFPVWLTFLYRVIINSSITSILVVVSEEIKTYSIRSERIKERKIRLIPNGISFSRFQQVSQVEKKKFLESIHLSEDHPILLTIARLATPKGHKYLLQAAPSILEKYPETTFLFVGEGPLRVELEQQVRASGMSKQVCFLGVRQDILEILSIADIFVLPSVTEGLPIALMEAMAMGLPVIATQIGGIETLVENEVNGITVQAGIPDKLSEAIIRLLNDRELGTRLGVAAMRSIHNRFSSERMCQNYQALFEIHEQEIKNRMKHDITLGTEKGQKGNTNNHLLVFNFHQRVQVVVEVDHPQDRAFFEAEYRYHRAQAFNDQLPTLKLHLRRGGLFSPSHQEGFTHYRHKLLANWSYKIVIRDELIEIEALAGQLAVPMVHHMLVHPSLRWLCAKQGLLLLHAGAVARDGVSLIMTGKGGSGKTTTTSILLLEGEGSWQPHADDYVFLAKPRGHHSVQSLAYMTRSHLYRDLLRWVPEIGQRLSPYERIRLEIFGLAREWSHDGLKWPVRLPVDRLWPNLNVANSANLAGFILLSRLQDEIIPRLELINTDPSLVDDLLEMNFREARHFLKLVSISGSRIDFNDWLVEWKGWESDILKEILENVPAFQLYLPKKIKFDPTNRHQLYNLFEKHLNDQYGKSEDYYGKI